MKIILATQNTGKLKEIQHFLQKLPITLVSQVEFNIPSVAETGLSFIENALIKARHAAKYSHLPALADDSGLVVDRLEGKPGIYSARFAGIHASDQDNIKKLLHSMSNLTPENRTAHFYCALAFVRRADDPVPLICQAKWDGTILTHPSGNNGFGYDPLFYIPSLKCTAAQLDLQQKNLLSHRAKALTLFCQQFKQMNLTSC